LLQQKKLYFFALVSFLTGVMGVWAKGLMLVRQSLLLLEPLLFLFWRLGLGCKFKASHLRSQALYHLKHTSSPFLSHFGDWVLQTVCRAGLEMWFSLSQSPR
jgi:hypothetical protein